MKRSDLRTNPPRAALSVDLRLFLDANPGNARHLSQNTPATADKDRGFFLFRRRLRTAAVGDLVAGLLLPSAPHPRSLPRKLQPLTMHPSTFLPFPVLFSLLALTVRPRPTARWDGSRANEFGETGCRPGTPGHVRAFDVLPGAQHVHSDRDGQHRRSWIVSLRARLRVCGGWMDAKALPLPRRPTWMSSQHLAALTHFTLDATSANGPPIYQHPRARAPRRPRHRNSCP